MEQEKILSHKLANDEAVEIIYDPKSKKTKLVLLGEFGEIVHQDSIDDGDLKLHPWGVDNHLIKSNVIKLPSSATEYESIQELYREIREHIEKYVKLSDEFTTVSALYVMMSWVYDQFSTIPYLRVIGTFGTGKTRFLETIDSIAYKSILTSGAMTPAVTFRTLDKTKGTLLIDEADFRYSGQWADITKILNSGHAKSGSVMRMKSVQKSGEYESESFFVFGPKVIASRERFEDEALESRCLTQILIPKNKIGVPLHIESDFYESALNIRNKLLMFRLLNQSITRVADEELKKIGMPRVMQSALAIVSVASMIDAELVKEVIDFCEACAQDIQSIQTVSIEAEVMICISLLQSDEKYMERFGDRIRIKHIAIIYSALFNDFSDGTGRSYPDRDFFLSISEQDSKPRQIGHVVSKKLHFKTARDGDGIFIPKQESRKIKALKMRYGLTDDIIIESKQTLEFKIDLTSLTS